MSYHIFEYYIICTYRLCLVWNIFSHLIYIILISKIEGGVWVFLGRFTLMKVQWANLKAWNKIKLTTNAFSHCFLCLSFFYLSFFSNILRVTHENNRVYFGYTGSLSIFCCHNGFWSIFLTAWLLLGLKFLRRKMLFQTSRCRWFEGK